MTSIGGAMLGLAEGINVLSSFDKGKGTNSDEYPVLKTYKGGSIEDWWNELDSDSKFEVGSVAVHYEFITPNSAWGCEKKSTFNTRTKRARKAIEAVLKIKDEKFRTFVIENMIKF